MRRALAKAMSVTFALGLSMTVAPAAFAADLGTVTVAYAAFTYSVSPSELTGQATDTFTLKNTMNDNANSFISLVDSTGAVSLGGTACSADTSCKVNDAVGSDTTGTFTVMSPGVVTVRRYLNGGSTTTIGTITISSTGPSAVGTTNPAMVYPTATFDPNGGSCTGTLEFSKYNGQNGTVTTPNGGACTRAGYRLMGWARSSDAAAAGFSWWGEDQTVPIGDESFTLFAVWSPVGAQVTYDANVGADATCSAEGANTDNRSFTEVVAPQSASATQAPCTPTNMVLSGWALTGDGEVAVQPGGAIPGSWTDGSSHRLYAVWKVAYTITVSADPSVIQPNVGISVVTVLPTLNGSPAPNAAVSLVASGSIRFGNGGEARTVTTDSRGQTKVLLYPLTAGSGYVTASFGDKTATATIQVRAPLAEKSIAIMGERGTVKGKPGIVVDGVTTGFAEGDVVVPWIKFPGQTTYSEGSARPKIDESGEFYWQRKTGKKIYIYFTNEDGSVKSDRIIIQAK